jgi:type I restriction enzyme S subunit
MSQDLYDLPEGWEWKSILDVAKIGVAKGFIPSINESGQVAFIGMSDIDEYTGLNSSHVMRDYSEVKTGYTKFQKNSVLVAKITPCTENNKTALIDSVDGFATTEVFPVHPSSMLSPKYLLYFFRSQSIREVLISKMEGATGRQRVPLKVMQNISIPLPPLAEQTRIVEKLDAVLSRIDTAIDELQQSLALVDAMFKSGLDQAFNPLGSPSNEDGLYDLPEGWGWKSLGNISTIGTGVTPLKGRTDFYQNGNINWVTSKATGDDFVIDSEQKITDIALSECRLKTYPIGTLIIALYGQGKTRGQVSELLIESTINQALAAVVICSDYDTRFVKYFLKKSYFVLRDKASGGTQENLNLSIVKAIQIPLPILSEQQKVVKALDTLNEQITQLKTELTAKIGMFNQLKASVLDGAFRGVKNGGNYE